MDRGLRPVALSCLRLGLILLLLPAFAGSASGQELEETPIAPLEVTPLEPLEPGLPLPIPGQDGSVPSLLDIPRRPPLSAGKQTVAELRGLDKVTGVAQSFEVPVGGVGRFGRLRIRVSACHGRSPDQPPEAAAFLQVIDTLEGTEKVAFSGWMFASSPGLSAMDHARYDVWVLHCRTS